MKSLLLRMIEWQAWAAHGPEFDTWESGRFLEQWGDPGTLESLRSAFAHYDGADIRSAILSTMDVFRTISTATANRLGLAYPTDVDANVTDWVRDCLGISRRPA